MKFEIQKQQLFRPGFYIEVSFMHGDADSYTEEVFGPFKEDKFEEASEFIEFLDYVINGRYDKGGSARRRNLDAEWPDKYIKFVNLDDIDFNKEPWPMFTLYDQWPRDQTCDFQYRASIDGWVCYYIDDEGRKFDVKVS